MFSREIENRSLKLKYKWVNFEDISPYLKVCALASEDQNFTDHFGFDFKAIKKAVKFNAKHKRTRGASTISQQVAKNLFLWHGRSWIRKGLEIYFTFLIELFWSKERILEVYLNIAEMGKLTFGVQAASQKYFKKDASDLTIEEASRIISVLPSPLKWNPVRPGPFVAKRQRWIRNQFYLMGGKEILKEI